jgi:hypothetical protein
LNTQFEKLLLSALLKDKQFLNESISYIDDDIFQNQYYKYFFFIIETYHKKCKDIIPYETFIFLLQKTINSQGFHKEESSIIVKNITEIFNTKYDINFIKEELSSHIKTRKFKKRLSQAIKDFDINKVETILSDLKNINKYNPDSNKPVEYVSSLNNRKSRHSPIPTKINDLDNKLSGGIAPGEFGLINAQTGGCKSTLLLNFAWGAVMDKKKVLFVTLEDSIETVMQRFDALFSNLDFITFRKDPDKSKTLLKKVEKHKNLLYIKDFTGGDFSISKLGSIVASMKNIDLIILELANETNIPIWTASQTAASSYGKEFVGLRDTYGGKGKVHIAHIVLTVCQTEDELKNNKLRLLVSKQKAGPKGGVISCNINLAKVRIWDANIL